MQLVDTSSAALAGHRPLAILPSARTGAVEPPLPSRSSRPRALGAAALCLACALPAAASPADREALRRAIDGLVSQQPLATARISLEVVGLDDGKVLYARAPEQLLNPASNTKLVTAAAALLRLGPEYRFLTDFLADQPLAGGKVGTLYVKGRGDPSFTTERLEGLALDLYHRGLREVRGDLVLDDTFFDREAWGPGWEQETSDKSYAAGVSALSLNHNSVGIYVFPGESRGAKARVELEPASAALVLDNRVITAKAGGRKRLKPHTVATDVDRTRVVVQGRIPLSSEGEILFRRVEDGTRYFGETLRALFALRGVKIGGKVVRGSAPPSAVLVASYESDELGDLVRDMNKVSSNFMAEMLVKTLGAELKGIPGSWAKGIDVIGDVLAELGIPRGGYVLKNGSGLNDTNRLSAHQLASLLVEMWRRFPVAAEFVSSLGIAARDGTMKLRMEGTEAAGRLRAKTGTLEKVTALSGYVSSLGGERFAFSMLVNDWQGKTTPVLQTVDRLGGLLASVGAPETPAGAAALVQEQPAELRARFAAYAALAKHLDKKNLAFLRSALRTERDPLLRVVVADALYQSDPEQGGGPLLEAFPATPDLYLRLRALGKELQLPLPAVSSLLDLAAEGSLEAMSRLFSLAPLARGAERDEWLEAALCDGFVEVGQTAPDELMAALRAAPAPQSQAAVELLAAGFALAGEDPDQHPAVNALRQLAAQSSGEGVQAQAWLATLQQRLRGSTLPPPPPTAPAVPAEFTPAPASFTPASPASFSSPPAAPVSTPPPSIPTAAAAVPQSSSGAAPAAVPSAPVLAPVASAPATTSAAAAPASTPAAVVWEPEPPAKLRARGSAKEPARKADPAPPAHPVPSVPVASSTPVAPVVVPAKTTAPAPAATVTPGAAPPGGG